GVIRRVNEHARDGLFTNPPLKHPHLRIGVDVFKPGRGNLYVDLLQFVHVPKTFAGCAATCCSRRVLHAWAASINNCASSTIRCASSWLTAPFSRPCRSKKYSAARPPMNRSKNSLVS